MPGTEKIALIGATSRIGRILLARLNHRGIEAIALGRSAQSLAPLGAPAREVDFADPAAFARALADADAVVSCAPLTIAPQILAALPERASRIIFTGSTRRFSRYPDAFGAALQQAETAFARSGRAGVILHATMIVGAGEGYNVQRLAALIRRFGIIALPRHGDALVQPIHVEDVAASLERALDRATVPWPSFAIAGRDAVAYRDFVRAIAAAIGRRVRIVPIPASALLGAAALTRLLPVGPRIEGTQILRLLEDKAFDITVMRERLGIEPMGLEAMLARSFAGAGAGP
ncbi:MAG: SDR family oxidoreductase [Stellaceae bacterium]